MDIRNKIRQITTYIESLYKSAKKALYTKKTLALLLGLLLCYKIYKFPLHISSSDFMKLVENNQVESVSYLGLLVAFSLKNNSKRYLTNYATSNIDSFNSLLAKKSINYNHFGGYESFIINPYNQLFALTTLFSYILVDTMKENSSSKKSKEDILKGKSLSSISSAFENLVTSKNNKDQFVMAIDHLINPEKYKFNKIKPVKGILLYGKPGTGKTLVAKCLSKLHSLNFINTCSSEYVEIYVGTGAKKVREYFKAARQEKPSIIFIDELEAIGVQRSSSYSNYTNNIERNATLNQLLSEMDGIEANEGILVIAATNREDLLDPALIRPGRFDMKIHLDLPNKEERLNLFELYLKKHDNMNLNNDSLLGDSQFLDTIADNSEGLSGAVIEDIVNKSAYMSYSKGEKEISKHTLETVFKKSKEDYVKFKYYEEKNKGFMG